MKTRASEDFAAKYDKYGNMLFRLCMFYLSCAADAEDAMQDVFIRLLYKAPRFSDTEHEKRWLLRVAINGCKNRLGSSYRKAVPLSEDIPVSGDSDKEIAEAILNLPLKYKDVVHLHYAEGYSIKELCGILGIGESAAKMRLSRARELLRMELEGS